MKTSTLEAAVWVLVYGGLLSACLGAAVDRGAPAPGGWLGGWMMWCGGLAALLGLLLIFVRARRPP